MSGKALCCTKCGEMVVKSMHDGSLKIRSKVVLVKDDGLAYAICKGCETEIPVPLRSDDSLIKSMMSRLRLYVKR